MIAPTEDIFHMWDTALRKLHAIRQVLMSGLGNLEMRDKLWENQYWKGADQVPDKKLDFPEVERICRRLNNHLSFEELNRVFKVFFFCYLSHVRFVLTVETSRKQIPGTVDIWISTTFVSL
jgi:hypothetical protein